MSVRNETAQNESVAAAAERNEFLDSLSGLRTDSAKPAVGAIFVPSPDDELESEVGVRGTAETFFEDEEADDVFEQSLSGLKVGDTDAGDDVHAIDEVAEAGERVVDDEPERSIAASVELSPEDRKPARFDDLAADGRTETLPEVRKGPTAGTYLSRGFLVFLFGLVSFAAGSAVTMFVFELPPAIPLSADLPVMAAPAHSISPPPGMVFVNGGEFLMGSDEGDAFARPAHVENVGPFYIDQTEVTNEAYFEFVKATRHMPPSTWVNGTFPDGEKRYPVTGVTWYDAVEFAAWRGKRLPTETEWEFAARGSDSRLFPWGNEWDGSLANTERRSKGVREVGKGGKSPFGLFDMAGNAWEWTSSDAKGFPGGKAIPWSRLRLKIIRGGNWQSDSRTAATFFRGFYGAFGEKEYKGTGFRCVKDIPKDH